MLDPAAAAAAVPESCGVAELRSRRCWSYGTLWRLGALGSAAVRRADRLLSAAFRPSRSVAAAADALLRETAALSTGSGSAVHCVHARVRGAADWVPMHYPPLADCGALGLRQGGCDLPCSCRRQADTWPDHDWVLRKALGADVRPGDAVFVATNNASHPRVRRILRTLRQLGVAATTTDELMRRGAASSVMSLGSPVLVGAAEQAACAGVGGSFFGACGSTWTEYVLDLRAWRGLPGADRQRALFAEFGSRSARCHDALRTAQREIGARKRRRRRAVDALSRLGAAV
eukprot:TRINITY_DN11337_c0_g1_i1.p1 TRINITY_DN11337_c0_g1~~TRINITY_DN11337_c0_g1_i1.p1  ORF type:complete len:288 (+),score=70.44 TRINITY_DN11337_c0_g1_i1:320-1183(+)